MAYDSGNPLLIKHIFDQIYYLNYIYTKKEYIYKHIPPIKCS